jgi:hypothetical protein
MFRKNISVLCAYISGFMILVTMMATAFAQTPYTLEKRVSAQSAKRYGDLPLGAVIRTDERYSHDRLIQGPRGWHYWNRLENPKDFQNPNLWGDKLPTYFMGQMKMPPGTRLTMRGQFPNARYFKIALYRFEHNTFIALGGEDLAAWDIEPDPGSSNPYLVGADRQVKNRSYTAHIVTEDAPANPADRAKNTMYAGRQERSIQIVFRIYVSDEGYDGAGLERGDSPSSTKPLVRYEATLADGTRLSSEEIVERFAEHIGFPPPPVPTDKWYALINSKDNDPNLDPASAPARKEAQWEIFRGIKYTLVAAFMSPEEKAKIKLQTEMEGGGDPTTVYMMNFLSRKFGPIYVFRGKMPTFPDTYTRAETMGDGQVKYWSVVTAASAPSGELWDGVYDLQVPLDKDGYYTIVVSRPEDRPRNAIPENDVAWIDWGPGEGLDDPRDRKDWGMLLMRFMVCHPDWGNSPAKARKPGTEEAVMGPYFPKGYYTTKEEFEAKGIVFTKTKSVKKVTVNNTRDMRFGEILVVKKGIAEVYNTTGLNECPAELWDSMDLNKLAKKSGALRVQKNGPKYWMMDSQTLMLGEKASFGGLEARWAASLQLRVLGKAGAEPYKIFTPKKTQRMVYAKGKPVFELVDPDGHAYVLQAHGPEFTLKSLLKLGEQMKKLPKGWLYRTRILDEDLILDLGPDQTIYAVGDEFHQYYTRIQETK